MTMPVRHFDKCLKTMLRHGYTQEAEQHTYILPYEGNLTDSKFDRMAEKLAQAVAPFFTNHSRLQLREALKKRLRSEWYTGREKDVTLSQYEFNGNWTLSGQGWFQSNFPTGHFVIVE